MTLIKLIILAIILIFLVSFSNAAIIDETKLTDLGQTSFEVNETNTKKCFETQFSPTVELNPEIYGIISVHAEFLPTVGKQSFIEVLLNNEQIDKIKTENFVNEWGRFNIPQGKILLENTLKICSTTSFEVSKITVLSDSLIGYYTKADFEPENAFQITVTPREPRFLEEFTITGELKNFGSESALVLLKYRKDELEKETPETELIRGETQTTKTIPKCVKRNTLLECIEPGVIEFEYNLRPKVIGPITLLPSIVEYENPFFEKISLESNRPTIRIIEPEIKIKPFIQMEKHNFLVGEKASIKLLITNEGQNPLFNLSLNFKAQGLDLLKGTQSEVIELIRPNETLVKEFTISSLNAGSFKVGCSIDYLDYDVVQSSCSAVTIEVSDPALDITIMGAAALLVFSIAIYIYIHLKK